MGKNEAELIKFLSKFGAQSLIVPFKDKNKSPTDIPVQPKTLAPKNVLKNFGPMNQGGDFGLFFLVNESNHPIKRTLSNITRCRAIWVEDDKTGSKRKNKDWPIPPNIIVNSSPNKYHYYWLTDTTNTDEHQRVMQMLVNDYNCDPNARDISRIMRIPGTYHLKKDKFMVSAEYPVESPYTWDTILDAFPPVEKVIKDSHSVRENGESGFDMAKTVHALVSGENYHGSMISLALYFANQGMHENAIKKTLLAYQPLCVDQVKAAERFSENHLKECIQTALNKIASEHVELPTQTEIKRDFNIKSKKLDKDVLIPPNTIFGALSQIAYESGYRRNLMSGFLGAAATIAYLGGGKYVMDGEKLKLSIQQIGLGRSGVGKDPIVSAPAEFIDAAFFGNTPFQELYEVITGNMSRVVGSRQGIENTLRESNKHDFLLSLDEVGDFIGQAIQARTATTASEMMTFLLEIFSSGATYSGRKLASSTKKGEEFKHKVLYSPTVTLTGASTTEKFSRRMGSDYVTHGSAARMVIQNCDLYAEEAVAGRPQTIISKETVPENVRNKLVEIADQGALVKGANSIPLPMARSANSVKVTMSPEIALLFFEFGEYANKEETKAGAVGPIWNRAAINAKLYAMIFAVAENPKKPVIEEWMAINAIKIVAASLDYQSELFDEGMISESREGKLRGAILSSLIRHHPKALSISQLSDSSTTIRNASRIEKQNAYRDLIDENRIEERKFIAPGAKKPTTVYALVMEKKLEQILNDDE